MDSPAWKPDEIDELLQDWPAMDEEINRYSEVLINAENALTSEYRAPTKDQIAAYVKAARDVVTIFHEKMYNLKRQILSVPVELAPSNDALCRSFLRMDVFYCDNCKKIVAKYLDFIHVVEPEKHGIFDSVFDEFSGMGKNCSCWAAQ